ncbi:hypothetical protein ACFVU2_18975 [Leifsonia sp. NPDC058194]|uniref:hypothetical protein n=1 Tax=Leifsonia sp. NPDC058194 TaxID=3346374 RepID=UPI0036DEC77D
MRTQLAAAAAVSALLVLTACSSTPAASSTHKAAAKQVISSPAPLATTDPTHTIDAAADAKAAAILQAEDDKLRAGFTQAQQLDDAGQQQWWASFGDAVKLENEVQGVFKQADANFTADSEPPSIGDWRNTSIEGDLQTWVLQPKDAEASYSGAVTADLATMDAKVAAVKAGQ